MVVDRNRQVKGNQPLTRRRKPQDSNPYGPFTTPRPSLGAAQAGGFEGTAPRGSLPSTRQIFGRAMSRPQIQTNNGGSILQAPTDEQLQLARDVAWQTMRSTPWVKRSNRLCDEGLFHRVHAKALAAVDDWAERSDRHLAGFLQAVVANELVDVVREEVARKQLLEFLDEYEPDVDPLLSGGSRDKRPAYKRRASGIRDPRAEEDLQKAIDRLDADPVLQRIVAKMDTDQRRLWRWLLTPGNHFSDAAQALSLSRSAAYRAREAIRSLFAAEGFTLFTDKQRAPKNPVVPMRPKVKRDADGWLSLPMVWSGKSPVVEKKPQARESWEEATA